jgi:hypothetical protein
MSVAIIGSRLGVYLPLVLLAVALLIGVLMVYRHRREANEDDTPASGVDRFSELKQAKDQMTEAEFRRVRELLIGGEGARSTKVKRPTNPAPEVPPIGSPHDAGPPPPAEPGPPQG